MPTVAQLTSTGGSPPRPNGLGRDDDRWRNRSIYGKNPTEVASLRRGLRTRSNQAAARVKKPEAFGLVISRVTPTLPPIFSGVIEVPKFFPTFCVSRFDKPSTGLISCSEIRNTH